MRYSEELISRFKEVNLEQIPRAQNTDADALAKLGSQKEATMLGVIPLEIQVQPSIPKLEVMNLEPATEVLWTTPIMEYITKGIVPEKKEEAKRLKYQAVMNASTSCEKSTKEFVAIIQVEPLWHIKYSVKDIIGLQFRRMHIGSLGRVIVVKAVDYFTKWAEAEPLATITAAKINEFVFRAIGFTAVYHPQSNGQIEVVNKIIKHTLKTKLEERKGCWPEELPMVLWSYNTTPRTTTGESPFTLTYGCEAMLPVEIGAGSFRRDNYDPGNNEVNHRLYLDLVEEVRATAQLKLATYQQRTRKYFDDKVRARPLKVGSLVLRRMMPNMKVHGHGVFGANWEGLYLIKAVLGEDTYHLTDLDGKLIPRAWNEEHLKKYYQ
ncbi:hypothetical protein POM88_008771 [Heracleum sosnowskyi]|uniref:Integrase catalytic domain-containing protein n=1 Tax=Heracleum sosnowskyi TaxID=360622 RepID=A0AAD8J9D2_9APIA|nr:hypothetical protein POM88_008771 [Heracleum sosnowskyi]